MGWQWHRLDHMQISCTLLQTDDNASTSSLNFLQAECSSWRPTEGVKALKVKASTTESESTSTEELTRRTAIPVLLPHPTSQPQDVYILHDTHSTIYCESQPAAHQSPTTEHPREQSGSPVLHVITSTHSTKQWPADHHDLATDAQPRGVILRWSPRTAAVNNEKRCTQTWSQSNQLV